MAINKMTFTGVGGIDLTGDTVVETDVANGKIFHKADGTQATGTAQIGGDTFADMYLKNTQLQKYENNNYSYSIPNYAFAYAQVKEVEMRNAYSIGEGSFRNCSIEKITLDKVTTMISYAFYNAQYLKQIDLPLLNAISGEYCFSYAGRLVGEELTWSFPNVTLIGNRAFADSGVTYINIPKVTTIYIYAFANSKLKSITIPTSCSTINAAIFYNCTQLETVIYEGTINDVKANMFNGCSALTEIDLSHCQLIPTLVNVNAFSGVPSTCVIKVPAALEEEWKQATNWVTYATQIIGV